MHGGFADATVGEHGLLAPILYGVEKASLVGARAERFSLNEGWRCRRMDERRCCRCREVIIPGEDFYSDGGQDNDEVYCCGCIDDALEHEWFSLDIKEKAEMMGYGVYIDEPEKKVKEEQIPGQLDMFGGMVE